MRRADPSIAADEERRRKPEQWTVRVLDIIAAEANQVGQTDGSLSLWIDDVPVGSYGPGYPAGTWLRETFHEGGCEFSACEPPSPFEGFDFRTSSDVRFKEVILDAYYERDTSAAKRAELEARGLQVSDEQTILYDDVVVATERDHVWARLVFC